MGMVTTCSHCTFVSAGYRAWRQDGQSSHSILSDPDVRAISGQLGGNGAVNEICDSGRKRALRLVKSQLPF